MAEGTNVGKLTVTISGDDKDLQAAAKRAGTSLQSIDKSAQSASRTTVSAFSNIARGVTAAIGAFVSVTAAIRVFQDAIANITALDQLSQTTGITIERLSELRDVALQTGISFDTLSQAASQWGTRITQALQSPMSVGSQAIRALGLNIKDAQGNIRAFDDLLPDLADKFSGFADGANKSALAAALFGEEAGPRLIPLLNQGRAGLDQLRQALGHTITQEDAERARDYQLAVGQLRIAWDQLATEFARFAEGPAAATLTALASVLRYVGNMPQSISQASGEWARLGQQIGVAQAELDRLQSALQPLFDQFSAGSISEQQFEAQLKRITDAIETQRSALERLTQERGRSTIGPWTTTVTPELPGAPSLNPDALLQAQQAYQEFMDRITGTRSIFDQLNAQWTSYGDIVAEAMQKANAAVGGGIRGQIAMRQAQIQVEKQYQEGILQTGTQLAQTIAAIWPKQKGAAIASALINTAVAVTRALTSGIPPWNFAQAALVAAAGAAQVAAIRSTNVDGSGGGGGTTAASGTSASASAPAETTPQPSRAVIIQGLDPVALFSGRQVEDLIRAINTEVQNGATLISTRNLPI